MAGAAQQGGGQSDNSASMLWSIAALFATLGAIWFVFKKQLIVFILTLKLFEVKIMSGFATLFFHPDHFETLRMQLESARFSAATLTFNQFLQVTSNVGVWLRWPFVIILLILGVVVYFSNTTRAFKHIYSMNDLAKLEVKNWPQITPILNLDLIKTDIDTGPWAMAMTPMQYCKKYHLLEEVRPTRREGMSRKDWDKIEVVLKRGEANKLFAMQLGALWVNSQKLPPHARALFAVFAARINADSKAAAALLAQFAISSATQLDFSGVDALLQKHEKTKLVQQVVQNHAYVSTVMASMLKAAREDGVQASSDFLWLKPLDRRLWYTLNTVGRQTPFIEVAGIFAHWVAENEAGRKLLLPMVDEATNAVDIALKDVVYRPDEV